VNPASWPRPELFQWLQEHGAIPERDLWHTFNLGIGYCVVLPEADAKRAIAISEQQGLPAWLIGEIVPAAPQAKEPVLGLPA
jgi:Phosphoribosylaminoimidazole (AIR) synthetase